MTDIKDFRISHDRFDEGYDAGREAGIAEGSLDARDEEIEAAVAVGYQAGLNAPDNEHFAAGYKVGVADTRRLPQETYQEGYSDGYDAGLRYGDDDESYDDRD